MLTIYFLDIINNEWLLLRGFYCFCWFRGTVRWKCGLSTGRNGVPHGSMQKSCVQHQQQWAGVGHELGHGAHGRSRWVGIQIIISGFDAMKYS